MCDKTQCSAAVHSVCFFLKRMPFLSAQIAAVNNCYHCCPLRSSAAERAMLDPGDGLSSKQVSHKIDCVKNRISTMTAYVQLQTTLCPMSWQSCIMQTACKLMIPTMGIRWVLAGTTPSALLHCCSRDRETACLFLVWDTHQILYCVLLFLYLASLKIGKHTTQTELVGLSNSQ